MQSLKGFRDFFPEEMAERSYLFDAWRRIARRFGFAEWDGPPLESLELYTRKSGEEIVGQLYNFQDKGGRNVALRPEMTPTLARMMAARASTLPKPIKWFSVPQLFRYERSQRGRLREHYQLNVDIVGAPEVEADAELLAVALEIQRQLGLTEEDVVARVNDRRVLGAALFALGVDADDHPRVYAAIDKFRKVPRETFEQLLLEANVPAARVAELIGLCAGDTNVITWFQSQRAVDEAGRDAAERLARYLELMKDLGLESFVELDFSIVRGLAYYTGIVFELYDRKGKERAICGGGRYDDSHPVVRRPQARGARLRNGRRRSLPDAPRPRATAAGAFPNRRGRHPRRDRARLGGPEDHDRAAPIGHPRGNALRSSGSGQGSEGGEPGWGIVRGHRRTRRMERGLGEPEGPALGRRAEASSRRARRGHPKCGPLIAGSDPLDAHPPLRVGPNAEPDSFGKEVGIAERGKRA